MEGSILAVREKTQAGKRTGKGFRKRFYSQVKSFTDSSRIISGD
jgi:hypothetical protein